MNYKKRCTQCLGKLGLGIRFKNLWTGNGWTHLRFCSKNCERTHEAARRMANDRNRWLSFLR